MKLKYKKKEKNIHSEIVTSVCWTSNNQLFSLGDDKIINIWDSNGDFVNKFMELDNYITYMEWSPNSKSGNETLAIGTSEGSLKLLSRAGKIEKSINEAHNTAIICIKWTNDGTALATAGEDGQIKYWSRQGIIRATLVQGSSPIYAISFSHDESFLLYSCDKNLCIKPVAKGGLKTLSWKGHDGIVLCAEWCQVNKLIVSGGEDCKYRIWDQYGRSLFVSSAYDYVITSVAWAPNGEFFAVGSFETIILCNKNGWTYNFSKVEAGSIMRMAWATDGTTVAAAGGNGSVVFGFLIERSVSWQNVEVKLTENNKLVITDYQNQDMQDIDFKDKLVDMSLGYNYLISITSTQCHIFNIYNLQTPYKFDLKETIKMILLCPRYFVLIDDNNKINLFSYEGKALASPNVTGMRISGLSKKFISISNEVIAILNLTNSKSIRLFDVSNGKPLNQSVEHPIEIIELALNQSDNNRDRKLCFIDNNKDLYITNVNAVKLVKLMGMTDCFSWNDLNDMICCISDEKFYAWVYPNSIYLDKELLDGSKYEKEANDIGKNSQILSFTGSICNILKADGSICSKTITPYAGLLLSLTQSNNPEMDKGLKLCRYVKDKVLWTAFSAICMNHRDISNAETAVASIEEVDKVDFINKIIKLSKKKNDALFNAHVALLCNQLDDAENYLLQSKLFYRAIKLNINLFRWDKALNIATTNKVHVDTVLHFRKKYLDGTGLEETNSKFLELFKEVKIDPEVIRANIQADKQAEEVK